MGRTFEWGSSAALVALCLGWLMPAASAEAWTASDAVSRALAIPDVTDALDARVRAIHAEGELATTIPNPSLELAHEQVFGDTQVGYLQTSIGFEQRFDWTGWRAYRRGADSHREAALRSEVDEWRVDMAEAVRVAYFQVRYHQERLLIFDAWLDRLSARVAAVRARQQRGDAAAYDVGRVERELALLRARRATEVDSMSQAWSALHTWVPWDERPTLSDALLPASVIPPTGRLLPRLARLEQLGVALDEESKAWGGTWWRNWSVGAAYRYSEVGASSGHGLVVSLAVPLAFTDTDELELDRLRAERVAATHELSFQRALADRAEQAASARLTAAFEAIQSLPSATADAETTHLAVVAYRAGEASLTDLLDAYRSEAELQLIAIDLHWSVRRAFIALERLRGIGGAP